MTTTRWATIFGLATALQGCVIYETDRRGDCWRGNNCGSPYEDYETAAPPVPEPVYTLMLAPDQGEAGTVLIVSVVPGDDLTLQAVTEVVFEAGVSVLASELRDDELLLSVEIAHDAVPGPYDVEVVLPDGEVVVFEDHFLVVPADMDPEDTGGGDPAEDPCTDTGA
jgi:hypothetical protein